MDTPTQPTLFGYAVPSSFRYELAKGSPRYPVPDPEWQARVYAEETNQEPPAGEDPQFQYNPKTKAGKALLNDLVASERVSRD